MRVLLKGKNLVLTDAIERYAVGKFSRLDGFRPNLDRAEVEVSRQATRGIEHHYTVQVNLIAERRLVLRAEEHAADPRVAIDALVDKVERTLQRQHERKESDRRLTAQGHLPPTPPEAFAEPSAMELVLADYGIDEDAIAHVQASGIRTMEQLRAVVEDGRLVPMLGPGFEHVAKDLERVVEQLRL